MYKEIVSSLVYNTVWCSQRQTKGRLEIPTQSIVYGPSSERQCGVARDK